MADDNGDEEEEVEGSEHMHPSLAFIPFSAPTQEQIERHQMAVTASQHETYRLFGELEVDQLKNLRLMLHVINCNTDGPNPTGEHFEGVASGVLFGKYNLCLACGVDHDKELNEMKEVTDDDGVDNAGS
jgi:hypothetical protein